MASTMINYSRRHYTGRAHPPMRQRNSPWTAWQARCITLDGMGAVQDFPLAQGATYIVSVVSMDVPVVHELQVIFESLKLPVVPTVLEYHIPIIVTNPVGGDPWGITKGTNPTTGTVGSSYVGSVTIPNYGIEQAGGPAVGRGIVKGCCQAPQCYGFPNGGSFQDGSTWTPVLLDVTKFTLAIEEAAWKENAWKIGLGTYQLLGGVLQV